MNEITVRELRNQGGDVLERVVERWRRLPAVDPAMLRADLDDVLDGSL